MYARRAIYADMSHKPAPKKTSNTEARPNGWEQRESFAATATDSCVTDGAFGLGLIASCRQPTWKQAIFQLPCIWRCLIEARRQSIWHMPPDLTWAIIYLTQ